MSEVIVKSNILLACSMVVIDFVCRNDCLPARRLSEVLCRICPEYQVHV